MRGLQGRFLTQLPKSEEPFNAFFPSPLPPDPPIQWTPAIRNALSRADSMLGRLDGTSRVLPDTDLFISFYSRKEAVLSSQIEGTQSTLSELLLFEADEFFPEHQQDIREVFNYLDAMRHGLERLQGGFPLSLRLIREMHERLLRTGRGSDKTPGEFRTTQNWFGGSRPGNAAYVPPPVNEMHDALSAFEKFLHDGQKEFPTLIHAAMLHLQFESIHPFLDGNGRLGRLLVTLLLVERQVLSELLLYPSLYLKRNRTRYYELLQQVRLEGNWEQWIEFFLEAIAVTAEQAVELSKRVLQLFRTDESRLTNKGVKQASLLLVLKSLQYTPFTTANHLVRQTKLSLPTVNRALEELIRLNILHEISGRNRNRVYRYTEYVAMLNEGTEL
jgi:Fic family protein